MKTFVTILSVLVMQNICNGVEIFTGLHAHDTNVFFKL